MDASPHGGPHGVSLPPTSSTCSTARSDDPAWSTESGVQPATRGPSHKRRAAGCTGVLLSSTFIVGLLLGKIMFTSSDAAPKVAPLPWQAVGMDASTLSSGCSHHLADARHLVQSLVSSGESISKSSVLEWVNAYDTHGSIASLAYLLSVASPNAEIRTAATDCYLTFGQLDTKVYLDRKLYERVLAVRKCRVSHDGHALPYTCMHCPTPACTALHLHASSAQRPRPLCVLQVRNLPATRSRSADT